MDIPRKTAPKKRARWITLLAVVAAVAVITVGLGRLRAAAPTVERASLFIGTVKRGPMLRQVKAPGTLVPEHTRWITAETAGRVDRILATAGATVTEDTLLVEIANPDVVLQSLMADSDVATAEAALLELRSRLRNQQITEESSIATLTAEAADMSRRAAAYKVGAGSVFSDLDARQVEGRSEELSARLSLAKRRAQVVDESLRDELSAQRAQIARRRDVAAFRKRQVEAMRVRAGGAGVLQELPVELGQWVNPGSLLAKVVQPDRLKAVLRVAELSAKDIAVGQRAEIDTRNGVIPGRVARVATAVQQGTVAVEITLEDPLPQGARPDLSVEGTITIEQLDDVLSVERPAGAQSNGAVSLFRLAEGDGAADRVSVELGRSSVSAIEIRRGLREGDRVIVSDMGRWDSANHLKIQ